MPKISVVVPFYKSPEPYIESILNQAYTDFEFLILDDCPDDDTNQLPINSCASKINFQSILKRISLFFILLFPALRR